MYLGMTMIRMWVVMGRVGSILVGGIFVHTPLLMFQRVE